MIKRTRPAAQDTGLGTLRALIPQINAREPEMEQYDDDALRGYTGEFRSRLDRGEDLDDLMVEAFAVVREASRRVLGERHHDVQLMGGAALHFGWLAEMKAGEGKTLASTLPAYLNSLGGKSVHVVTANEYLAARDAEWMGRIHRWLGLRVGLLTPSQPDPSYRREHYEADITYGTSDDFAIDYLRDNEFKDQHHQRQRGHDFALVDDADSILFDHARTNFMLRDKRGRLTAKVTLHSYFRMYDKLAAMTGTAMFDPAVLRSVYDLQVVAIPTNVPLARIDRVDHIYRTEEAKFDAVTAEVAKRREAAQPVLVGTASVEKSEQLAERLDRRGIPHQIVNANQHAREAEVIAQAGMLGAVTVAANMAGRGVGIMLGGDPEMLASHDLRSRDLDPHDPANAHELRATLQRCVAEAARERARVVDLGGLCVLGTERNRSRRLDDQLRDRAGRQGEPGESRFYVSLDDDIIRRMEGTTAAKVMDKALPDDAPLDSKTSARAIELVQGSQAQLAADWLEQNARYDDVEDEQRKVIYTLRNDVAATMEQLRESSSNLPAGLRSKIVERYLPEVLDTIVEVRCASTDRQEWDLEALYAEVRSMHLSTLGVEHLATAESKEALRDQLMQEALAHYEQRERELTPYVMRIVECKVMLRVLHLRWSRHLNEMEALRDSISWQAVGRIDAHHAWQEAVYEMFDLMMRGIASDTVRYTMTVLVEVTAPGPAAAQPDISSSINRQDEQGRTLADGDRDANRHET